MKKDFGSAILFAVRSSYVFAWPKALEYPSAFDRQGTYGHVETAQKTGPAVAVTDGVAGPDRNISEQTCLVCSVSFSIDCG